MQACGSKPEPEPTPSTPDPVLSVSPASLSFNQDGGSQTVQVTANNAPSRWAIYQQIMKRSGETPSFDAFLTYDAVNCNATTGAHAPKQSSADGASRPFVPTAPPVIVR